MKQLRGLLGTARYAAVGLACLGLLLATGMRAMASGQALVIGEASYASFPPLPGCALSAHAVAAALRTLGLTVDDQTDGSSGALYAAITALTHQMAAAPHTPTVIYFCGYVTSYEDRPFVLPVSASVTRPADALTQGLLAKTLLNAVVGDQTAAGVLILDSVPMPNGPSALSLDALTQPALPSTLGYIATGTTAPGNTPTPSAAALVPLLRVSSVETARLLTDVQQQLAGTKTASVSAVHLPDAGLYLGAAPAAAVPARAPSSAPTPTAPPPAAAPSPSAAAPPPPAAETAKSLPDEDQMTDDQRRLVQRALTHLGYYDARTDGVFGPETRAAIRRWQHEVHTSMTGHLTAQEASKLAAAWD
jgi:hypothetical protein